MNTEPETEQPDEPLSKRGLLKIAATLLLLIAVIAWAVHHDYYKHKEPPPGWSIVCDGQGHYGARLPIEPEFPDFINVLSSSASQSRQKAVNSAWKHYEFWKSESSHGEWRTCD